MFEMENRGELVEKIEDLVNRKRYTELRDLLLPMEPAGIVAMAGATLEVEGRVVHEDCFDEDVIAELARRIPPPWPRYPQAPVRAGYRR